MCNVCLSSTSNELMTGYTKLFHNYYWHSFGGSHLTPDPSQSSLVYKLNPAFIAVTMWTWKFLSDSGSRRSHGYRKELGSESYHLLETSRNLFPSLPLSQTTYTSLCSHSILCVCGFLVFCQGLCVCVWVNVSWVSRMVPIMSSPEFIWGSALGIWELVNVWGEPGSLPAPTPPSWAPPFPFTQHCFGQGANILKL